MRFYGNTQEILKHLSSLRKLHLMTTTISRLSYIWLFCCVLTLVSCRPEDQLEKTSPSHVSDSVKSESLIPKSKASQDSALIKSMLEDIAALANAGKYDSALLLIDSTIVKSAELLGNDTQFSVRCYNLKASVYLVSRKDIDAALEANEQAIKIALRLGEDGIIGIVRAYRNIGFAELLRGNYKVSDSLLREALSTSIEKFGENTNQTADLYHSLGFQQEVKGELYQAIGSYEKCAQITIGIYSESDIKLASTYNNLGNIYKKLGDYENAMAYLQKALNIRLNGPYNTMHHYVAETYNNIGTVFLEMGEYPKAKLYFEKGLRMREKLFKEPNQELAESYINLSIIENYEKRPDVAINLLQKAVHIADALPEVDIEFEIGINFNMGEALKAKGELEKAESYYYKSLNLVTKSKGNKYPDLPGMYSNIGILHTLKPDLDAATEALNKGLAICEQVHSPNHPFKARLYANLAEVVFLRGNLDQSLIYLTYASEILGYHKSSPHKFSEVSEQLTLQRILKRVGSIYRKQYLETGDSTYLEQLLQHYEIAIAHSDYIQRYSPAQANRRFYWEESCIFFEAAIEAHLLKARRLSLRQAFTLAEKTKARQLAEQVQLSLHETSFGLPDSLRQREHRLNVDLAYYEKKAYQEEFDSEAPNDSLLRSYRDRIFSLKEQRDALIERFRRDYPDYYRLRYSQAVIDVAGVQDSLLRADHEALLEYFVGDSAIYAFLLRRDTLVVRKIERDFPLEQWVEELRCGLFAGRVSEPRCAPLSPDSAQALYARRAHALYQKLVAPLDSLLPKDGHLTLVPDGVLGYLPFEALLRQAPIAKEDFFAYDYWLRHHRISYAYSATLQQYMRAKRHRQAPQPTVLAVAPRFDGEPDSGFYASRFIDPDLRRGHLTRLDYNDDEVRRIGQFVRADTLTGTAATREAFLAQASGHRVLHLATHGKANDQAGDNSFLAFYASPQDSAAEPLLYNRELYHLTLNADLVVLSACETGIGELQRGEGIISLARGFSYAGAKSIVTSLWSVNDQATQVLMTQFYQGLCAGLPKHEALRQAKLRLLRSDNAALRSPLYWAAFIPIGDMAPVELPAASEGSGWRWGLLLLVLLALGGGVWYAGWRHEVIRNA